MPVVKADHGQCQGYANCVVGADDTFDLDDDGVAATARQLGGGDITLVDPAPVPMGRVIDPDTAGRLGALHREHGVKQCSAPPWRRSIRSEAASWSV